MLAPSVTRKAAQNPLRSEVCTYLNLRGHKIHGSAAHKLVILGVAYGLKIEAATGRWHFVWRFQFELPDD